MIEISLQAIPNQKFSIRLDDKLYTLTIKAAKGIMCATIVRDNVTIQEGIRIVAGTPLMPFLYQESGNFVILTEAGDLPDYTQFGETQFLIYATQAELETIRAGV